MQYKNYKLWTPYNNIIIPQAGFDNKHVCLFFIGDNTDFFESYNSLNIPIKYIKHIYIPSVSQPFKSYLKPELRRRIIKRRLLPISTRLGEYSEIENINFFYNPMLYIQKLEEKYDIKKYNSNKALTYFSNFINTLQGIDGKKYDKTLLYVINKDKPINNDIFFKRFYPIYISLLNNSRDMRTAKTDEEKQKTKNNLHFDKILLYIYNSEGGTYVKVFDKNSSFNNIPKIKSLLTKIKNDNKEVEINKKSEDAVNLVSQEVKSSESVSTKIKNLAQKSVWSYLQFNKSQAPMTNVSSASINSLVKKSILFHSLGDNDKTERVIKKIEQLDPEKQKAIVNKFSKYVVEKHKSESVASDTIVKLSKTDQMTDYITPKHVFDKRVTEFTTSFKKDIHAAFDQLKNKDMPLKIVSIDVHTMESGPSEINKTIKDRYAIKLSDDKGNIQEVHIDFPKIDKWGAFDLNGTKWILVNQLVRFPIFFPNINVGRFESSFSTMKIISKQLQKGAYYQCFIGSYKFPLILLLSYMKPFNQVLKDYGIKYRIEE